MSIITQIIAETQLKEQRIRAVLHLLEEGATIPFIARYRKDATGNLDEVQVTHIKERFAYWTDFEKRRESILSSLKNKTI